MDLEGLPLIISDTAGIRRTEDLVEKIGIEKAVGACVMHLFTDILLQCGLLQCANRVQAADIAICVIPISDYERRHSLAHQENSADPTIEAPTSIWPTEIASLVTRETLVLFSKSDLVQNPIELRKTFFQGIGPNAGTDGFPNWLASLKSGDGIPQFLAGLAKRIRSR